MMVRGFVGKVFPFASGGFSPPLVLLPYGTQGEVANARLLLWGRVHLDIGGGGGVKKGLISRFPTRYLTSKSPLEQPQALFYGICGNFLVPTI